MTGPGPEHDAVREWLQASCAAQGVPVTIQDHAVISQVAILLGHSGSPSGRNARTAPSRKNRLTSVNAD